MSEHNGRIDLLGEQGSRPTDPQIPHQTQKQNKCVRAKGSQFTPSAASLLARSTREVCGWVVGPIRGEKDLEMKYVLGGCDCPTAVYLIPSSRVCNHEVNQHDTRTSITQTPFGVTSLLLESIQRKGKRKKKSTIYSRKGQWAWGRFVPAHFYHIDCTIWLIKVLHLSF